MNKKRSNIVLIVFCLILVGMGSRTFAQKNQDRLPSSGPSELPAGVTSRPPRAGEFSDDGSRAGTKGDLPEGARTRSQQPDNVVRTATGYGYGPKATYSKIQDRLPADRNYNGPVTSYRTVEPPDGNVAARNSWQGLFDSSPSPQNVGGMIISRDERMLYLQNGDRILLPINELWSGNARVNVDRIYDMPLHYQVTIRTKDDQSLSTTIENLVRQRGPEFAINSGLWVAAPEWQVTRGAVRAAVHVLTPTPLNEGEGVFWRIPSARNGVVDVWIVNER